MDGYKKLFPAVMIMLSLIFLLLYVVNPLGKNLDNKGQIVLLFSLFPLVSFWNKQLYYGLWTLMILGLILYYFIR